MTVGDSTLTVAGGSIDRRSFAVIEVGNNGDVAKLHGGCQNHRGPQ